MTKIVIEVKLDGEIVAYSSDPETELEIVNWKDAEGFVYRNTDELESRLKHLTTGLYEVL